MGKKVRSSRGEMVDFDLLKIKQQIASRPATEDVKARQNFIERKLQRRIRKGKFAKVEAPPSAPVQIAAVEVEPQMPESDVPDTSELIEPATPIETDPVSMEPTLSKKQKARRT